MHTATTVFLRADARPEIKIRTGEDGQRYLVLDVADGGNVPALTIFPAGPEFLDYLANECERAVREFVGDVPEPEVEPSGMDAYGSLG